MVTLVTLSRPRSRFQTSGRALDFRRFLEAQAWDMSGSGGRIKIAGCRQQMDRMEILDGSRMILRTSLVIWSKRTPIPGMQ